MELRHHVEVGPDKTLSEQEDKVVLSARATVRSWSSGQFGTTGIYIFII